MVVGGGRWLGKARHRKDCQSSPHPKNPHTTSDTDGNRKTDAFVLGGTVAATFTTSPHRESYTLAGSSTTRSTPPPLGSPTILGSWGFPGPHSPICPHELLPAVRSRLSGYPQRGLRISKYAGLSHLIPLKARPVPALHSYTPLSYQFPGTSSHPDPFPYPITLPHTY